MAGRRRSGKSRKKGKRRWKSVVLFLVVIGLVLGLGYFYRDHLFASVAQPADAPADDDPGPELPDPGADDPGETPAGDDPADEPPLPVLPDEELHIADGDYLLALVTKQVGLGRYEPQDLQKIPRDYYYHREYAYYLREEALSHLVELIGAARADGFTLLITSAYRSYDTQVTLFNNYASRHGEEEANKFSARAGYSEHQLGTTVDFCSPTTYSNSSFHGTPEANWLDENAHLFGFALSYPEDSSHITGYNHESWHFRYIGVEAAAEWKESGLILCLFLAGKPQYYLE